MTFVTFVRHATTEWMEQGRVHGRLDSPLSERGRREAHLTALHLKHDNFEAFYTSPALRAVETARIIGEEMDMQSIVLRGLREVDFGCMEGKDLDTPPGAKPTLWFYLRWAFAFPFMMLTGEFWPHFTRRVAAVFRSIHENHPEDRVLVVAHSGVHTAMLHTAALRDPRRRLGRYPLAPCGITQIVIGPNGQGRLIALNQTEHLAASAI